MQFLAGGCFLFAGLIGRSTMCLRNIVLQNGVFGHLHLVVGVQ